MTLNNDEVIQILKLIDESDYDDVRIEIGDVKIHIQKREGKAGDVPIPLLPPTEKPNHIVQIDETVERDVRKNSLPLHVDVDLQGLLAIRAPMLGTFFRAPAPGEKPFIEVGAKVAPADTICLVEVMKLFNSVKAGVAGTVVDILVENGAMVEYDQALIIIKPI